MFDVEEMNPDAIKPAKRRYRRRDNRELHRVPYKNREFIFWDGEGSHRLEDDSAYILFGCSIAGREFREIHADDLAGSDCFRLIIEVATRYPNHIHLAFAFNYDVVMMMKSLPVDHVIRLQDKGYDFYGPYRLEYRPGKWFSITDRNTGVCARINDIFSFFGCSAIQAATEYIPDSEYLRIVQYGKSKRDSFEYAQLHLVRTYMHVELKLYIQLATRLRTLLAELGVHPAGWYGPGAVSSAVMRKQGIKSVLDRALPDPVINASQHAYFGGRFEQFKTGQYHGKVYSYDVRSAYPDAMRTMPNLQAGFWNYVEFGTDGGSLPGVERLRDFALYHVRYSAMDLADYISPHPFPRRTRNGAIGFPTSVDNWYWGVEVRAALRSSPGTVQVVEGWEFLENDPTDRPFRFMAELYDRRQQWKDEIIYHDDGTSTKGNPVQLAAKLVLNSIYGKLAQRVGWNEDTMEPPTWHQLEYAGYTTAYCRAKIWAVVSQAPSEIIAIETDGIYSICPLSVPDDRRMLGDWEMGTVDGITYVQSGVYWTLDKTLKDGSQRSWSKGKTRGFNRKHLSFSQVKEQLNTLGSIQVQTVRFAGLSYAKRKVDISTDSGQTSSTRDHGLMSQWLTMSHVLEWGGSGKRKHIPENCSTCSNLSTMPTNEMNSIATQTGVTSLTKPTVDSTISSMHLLTLTDFVGGESWKHVLPWRDTDKHPRWEYDKIIALDMEK